MDRRVADRDGALLIPPVPRDPAVPEQILRIENSWDDGWLRSWTLSRDLARAKPNSVAAQADFAFITGFGLSDIPLEQRRKAVAAARESAARATSIRPEYGYILPCLLTPPGILTDDCDKALRRAVAADPEPPYASNYFASKLAHSGRLRESATLFGNALSQSPYNAGHLSFRMFMLEIERPADFESELPALRARAQRYAPDILKDELRYRAAVASGDFSAAERILDDPAAGQAMLAGLGRAIVKSVFRAVRTRNAGDIVEARRQCLPTPSGWNPPDIAFGTCLVGLTILGDLDSMFKLASHGYGDVECCSAAERERIWIDGGGLHYPRVELWGSAMAPARADHRFIELARRTGSLAYWKSGHPPDFCYSERAPVCALLSLK